jgi:hypothetical protein
MAESTLLTISIVMGLLLVAVGIASGRLRNWRGYTPADSESALQRSIRSPAMWLIGALVLCTIASVVIVVGAGVQGIVGDSGLLGGLVGIATLLVLFGLPTGYLLWGFHDLARKRGLGNAKAVGLSAWVGGMLLIVLIAFALVIS